MTGDKNRDYLDRSHIKKIEINKEETGGLCPHSKQQRRSCRNRGKKNNLAGDAPHDKSISRRSITKGSQGVLGTSTVSTASTKDQQGLVGATTASPQQGGRQHGGPQQGGPQQRGPQQRGPSQRGPQQGGPYQGGPQQGGHQQGGPQQGGPHQGGPQQEGPQQEQEYRAGEAPPYQKKEAI